ncbi:MAG: hypothetical protein ACK56I_26825, partial [bacterium]
RWGWFAKQVRTNGLRSAGTGPRGSRLGCCRLEWDVHCYESFVAQAFFVGARISGGEATPRLELTAAVP